MARSPKPTKPQRKRMITFLRGIIADLEKQDRDVAAAGRHEASTRAQRSARPKRSANRRRARPRRPSRRPLRAGA